MEKLNLETFKEMALPKIEKLNKKMDELKKEHGKVKVEYFSFEELVEAVDFQECETDLDFITEMLDEMELGKYYSHTEDELYRIEALYPSVSFDSLDGLKETNYEIFFETYSGDYCSDWLLDESQGSGFQKAYDVMVNQEYFHYETVEEYKKARKEAIEEFLSDFDEEDREDMEEAARSETGSHAIYLKDGSVAYILLSIEESIEHIS